MPARSLRRRLVAVSLAVASLSFGLGLAPTAQSVPQWAPAETATIHPGVVVTTPVGRCTSNFIFYEGEELYIGMAAHCAGPGEVTETNGCGSASLPLGTSVRIDGASELGSLAYSSWLTMQAVGESDPNSCAFNDFALVRIHPADHGRVNPSIPHWGGPAGVNWTTSQPPLSLVYSYGNSPLRQGLALLSPKTGVSLGSDGGGWTHAAYTLLPGIPGDSGSAMLDSKGLAAGVLSTITLAPLAGSNNFTDINLAMSYALYRGGFPGLLLANGTVPFNPAQLPLG